MKSARFAPLHNNRLTSSMAKLVQKVGNEWQVQVQEDLVRKRLSLGRGRLAGEQLLVESDTVPG